MQAQMEKDIDRLDSHVEEILMLARSEAEPGRLRREPLDLMDLIEPILADAELEGRRKSITIRHHGPEHLPVAGDPDLLHRAVENVIRNALKFAPAGSVIGIDCSATGDTVEVQISDQGPGVAHADLARIFEPYVRVSADSRKHGGGLGLAIAARAIAAHGGDISAERGAESGLRVRLRLPRRSP